MTRLLEKALETVSELTVEEQDEIARVIFDVIGDADAAPYVLSDGDRAAIEHSRKQAARGEFATDAEVEAVFAKFRRRRLALRSARLRISRNSLNF